MALIFTRGWLLFITLILGVYFRLWQYNPADTVSFPFSSHILDLHSHVYFRMEHVIAIIWAFCMLNPAWLQDETPNKLIIWFMVILALDFLHYELFFRDEGPGWNIAKAALFGLPLTYFQIRRVWHYYN